MTDHAHPSDGHSRIVARATSSEELTNAYEWTMSDRDKLGVDHAFGALQVVASLAIARCTHLEDRLAKDERRAQAALRPKTGNVVPLGPGRPPRGVIT